MSRSSVGQPEVMQLPGSCLLSDPVTVGDRLDLRWVQREEIVSIEDTKFVSISKPGNFHGLALPRPVGSDGMRYYLAPVTQSNLS